MTPMQKSIVEKAKQDHGQPDKIMVSDGNSWMRSGVVVRMDWCAQKRHLFILPDGSRMTFAAVEIGGVPVED